jgi:hypothetical protein
LEYGWDVGQVAGEKELGFLGGIDAGFRLSGLAWAIEVEHPRRLKTKNPVEDQLGFFIRKQRNRLISILQKCWLILQKN